MNVYRVTVVEWPTNDGKPWPQVVAGTGRGYGTGTPKETDLPWFHVLVDPDGEAYSPAVDDEFAEHDYAGEITVWRLPNPKRRLWFSEHAANEWVRKAELLGTVCSIEPGFVAWSSEVEIEWAVDYQAGMLGCSGEVDSEELAQHFRHGKVVTRWVVRGEWS